MKLIIVIKCKLFWKMLFDCLSLKILFKVKIIKLIKLFIIVEFVVNCVVYVVMIVKMFN